MCHIIGIEPQFENIIKNSPFIPMVAGQRKLEGQWTRDEEDSAKLRSTSQKSYNIPDFHDSPDDEEDTKSSQEYMNDLQEEYQARALLAKSKRFFKMGKNKGLIAETYEWDEEEVSSDENEAIEVKALMALANEERVYVRKESASNGEWVKIPIQKHVNTEILKENQNLRNELKELTSIIVTWLNNSNKVNQCISEQITIQKKKILGIDQLTENTSSSRPKDPVLVKSSADNSKVSITGSNKPKLFKAEDSTLSSHDTGKVPSNESQRNTQLKSVVSLTLQATDQIQRMNLLVLKPPLFPTKELAVLNNALGPKIIKSN
ncbi:hypothetical protein Tco_0791805 [Tanacetum coccineum]